MSGPQQGFLATYNSLTDKHLAGYFSNRRIRRHLQRAGLISKSGRIISEKEYRLNAMRKDHQKYVQECLAQAIFHKVLDMERHHQLEIKRRLENFVRKERVQKIKVEQSRRSVEDASLVLSPHPPLAPRSHHGLLPLVTGERASHSQLRAQGPLIDLSTGHRYHQHQDKEPVFLAMDAASRPKTAPGNLQGPPHHQPLRGGAAVATVQKTSNFKQRSPTLENDQRFASGGEKSKLRLMNSVEYVTGVSPYRLPVINNYVTPVPPPPLQTEGRSVKTVRNGMPRRRRFRPTTAPNDLEQILTKNSGKFHKPSLRSNALITMIFFRKGVHLSHDDTDFRDEIKVYQQHCGGENLCVYKGKLLEGETFQFLSKRHHGFPFSLTFFLNGMPVDRLSSCCEYKHQKHSRLGGRHGYFGFLNVERASPCYRCIIAMGLDKKPSPPKRRMEEENGEKQAGSPRAGVHWDPSEGCAEQKTGTDPTLATLSGRGASVEPVEDKMETGEECRRAEMKELSDHEPEDSQEDTGKNDYDEDFEADEEVNEEGQTSEQMSGKSSSKSSSDDEKDNLDHEKKSRNSSQKALQACDSEKDENDGPSDSDSEDNKQGEIWKGETAVCEKAAAARKIQSFYRKYKMQQKFKTDRSAHCSSSMSTLYSSEDDSAENFKDSIKGNEECDIERAAGNVTHTGHGNENGENDQARLEDNPEIFAPEKEGIDEAEETEAARVNTDFFHENRMAIQHQSPEVSGQLERAGSIEGSTGEDGEKAAHNGKEDGEEDVVVSLESRMMEVEDRNEESRQSDEGGDCKSVQEKMAEAIEDDYHMNSELEPGDSRADEKQENITSTEHVINEGMSWDLAVFKDSVEFVFGASLLSERPDLLHRSIKGSHSVTDGTAAVSPSDTPHGASLAEETRTLEIQKAAEQVVQEGQMVGEKQALEKEDSVAEEGGAHGEEVGQETTSEGDLLSQEEDTVAVVLVEGQLALDKSAPEERAMPEEDSKEEETGRGGEVAFGEQEVLKDVERGEEALRGQTPEGEEVLGAVVLMGEEVDGAEPEEDQVVQEAVQEAPEAEEVGSESLPEAEEAAEEGGFAGKDDVAEGQEAAEGTKLAEVVGVVGPEAEEAMEEAVSEGEEAVKKLGALLEASEEVDDCTEAAAPGREELKKTSEFPQLEIVGEEWIGTGQAALGAAVPEGHEPREAAESSLLRAEEAARGGGTGQAQPCGAQAAAAPEAPGAAAAREALAEATAGLLPRKEDRTPGRRVPAVEPMAGPAVPGGSSRSGAGVQATVVAGAEGPEGTEATGVAGAEGPEGAEAAAGAEGPEGAEAAARVGAGRPEGALLEAPGEDQAGAVQREQPDTASTTEEREVEAMGRRRAACCCEEAPAASVVLEEAEAEGTSGGQREAGARQHKGTGRARLEEQEAAGTVACEGHVEVLGAPTVGDEPSAGTWVTVPGRRDGAAGPAAGSFPAQLALSRCAEEEALETVVMEREPAGNEGPVEGETGEAVMGAAWKPPGTSEDAPGGGEGVTANAQNIPGTGEQLHRQQGTASAGPGCTGAPGAPGVEGAAGSWERLF